MNIFTCSPQPACSALSWWAALLAITLGWLLAFAVLVALHRWRP